MFREIRTDEHPPAGMTAGEWLLGALGLSFILAGLLIAWFPELLAWLVGGFLFLNGFLLLGIAWKYWRFKQRDRRWRVEWWLP